MKWHDYLMNFFSGIFIANGIPHFVNGISGDAFPTPFSDPAFYAPSSPTVNVMWALLNFIVGYLLLTKGKIEDNKRSITIIFFLGFAITSFLLGQHFSNKLT